MKKIFLYSMLFVAGLSFSTSCSDDDEAFAGSEADRLFMPMFRTTTNTASSTTLYHCDIASKVDQYDEVAQYLASKGLKASNHVNDMRLFWYEVDGAVGYQLKAKVQGTSWELAENPQLKDTILVGGDVNTFLHEDLQYGTGYLYAIRALASLDNPNDPRHSKWYGYGDGSHQSDQSRDDNRDQTGALTTGMRYEHPSIFWTENITETSMDVCFNPTAESGYESAYKDFIEAGAMVQDGKWVFDEIRVEPSADNPLLPTISIKPTAEEMAAGRVHVNGLESNAAYLVKGQNNKVERYYDRQYNSTMVRMMGDPGEPILIKANTPEEAKQDTILQNMGTIQGKQFGVQDLVATRIDTILTNYMGDNTIAEGQIFYLEGGKTYYTHTTVEMTKGFTLATNPEDLAAGKGRATVLQGVGYSNEAKTATNANNWGLCRNARSGAENGVVLAIQPIIFENINFHPYAWYNYYDQKGKDGNSKVSINGNYFMNMYSQGLSFVLNELRVSNCTMAGHVRGFIRFQGPNRQVIEKLTVDNCVFYDCGGYDTNGRGYSWFAGPGNNRNSNFYKNFSFTNNTIINSSRHALVTETKNLAWPDGTKWKINVSNNTFVNFAPRSNNNGHGLVFEIQYAPAGSEVTCAKNLFVFTGNQEDKGREYYMKGMRVSTKDMKYDFRDNYSTVVPAFDKYKASNDPAGTTLLDGMFTGRQFSHTSDGAGYQKGALNASGFGETQIKFGDNMNENEDDAVGYQLSAEELFENPWTIGTVNAKEDFTKDAYRHADISGFYYKNTDRVKNHPIYTKQIGDQRWRTGASWDGGNNITVKSGK
ncbi:MAG: hypothetical protein IJ413_02100 [Bacteroides sp.]|nr:hypothetical protein [Bacteroides sp.]